MAIKQAFLNKSKLTSLFGCNSKPFIFRANKSMWFESAGKNIKPFCQTLDTVIDVDQKLFFGDSVSDCGNELFVHDCHDSDCFKICRPKGQMKILLFISVIASLYYVFAVIIANSIFKQDALHLMPSEYKSIDQQ